MSFLSLASIETLFPETSAETNEQKIPSKPLQLTLSIRNRESEIWSPFDRIPAQIIPHTADQKPNVVAIHEALLKVKEKFPTENSIVLAPGGSVAYDILVEVMDSVRTIDATDPPLFARNEQTGNDEALKSLFPNVVFGNLLGAE
jgi:biopolymer transport protein ExbD